jgi:hypothetical protein
VSFRKIAQFVTVAGLAVVAAISLQAPRAQAGDELRTISGVWFFSGLDATGGIKQASGAFAYRDVYVNKMWYKRWEVPGSTLRFNDDGSVLIMDGSAVASATGIWTRSASEPNEYLVSIESMTAGLDGRPAILGIDLRLRYDAVGQTFTSLEHTLVLRGMDRTPIESRSGPELRAVRA